MNNKSTKSEEIVSLEKAIHDILWVAGLTATARKVRSLFKAGKLSPNMMEKIALEKGYKKVESSRWIKNNVIPTEKVKWNQKTNYHKKDE